MAEKAMVLFSGGVDSTTCLGLAMERFGRENVIALSIVYGQKHEKEVESARKILEYYGIKGLEALQEASEEDVQTLQKAPEGDVQALQKAPQETSPSR